MSNHLKKGLLNDRPQAEHFPDGILGKDKGRETRAFAGAVVPASGPNDVIWTEGENGLLLERAESDRLSL